MIEDSIEVSLFTVEEVRKCAIETLLASLIALDLVSAERAVRESNRDERDQAYIGVVPSDDGRLHFIMDCRIFHVELYLAPSSRVQSIDRDKLIMEKCSGIVALMQGAPVTEMGEHATCTPFAFWNSNDDDDAERWRKLSNFWPR